MKKVIFLSIIALFLSLSVQGQRTNIVVAIAKKSTQCGSTDIGYRMTYGTASNYALGKKQKQRLKRVPLVGKILKVKTTRIGGNIWGIL